MGKHNQGKKLIKDETQTFSCPAAGFDRRSASMSYFKTLKHSSRSSKKSAYVRTQAEQSQAATKVSKLKFCPLFICSGTSKNYTKEKD